MDQNQQEIQSDPLPLRPRRDYRLIAMILISIFGAVAMFYVRETPSEVSNVLWVIGIVYTSVVGVSIAGRARGGYGGYSSYGNTLNSRPQSPYIRNNQSRRPL